MSDQLSEYLSYSKANPNIQLAWDSTSLGELLFCPRRYQYRILEGYVPKKENVDLRFGIMLHSALEARDRVMAEGGSWEEAMYVAFDTAYVASYGWESEDKNKNRFTLLRTIIWYCFHYEDDTTLETYILPDGRPAIELSFRIEMMSAAPQGDSYLFCGHLDGAVLRAGDPRPWVRERKSTYYTLGDNYFAGFSPHHQISGYSMASRVVLPEASQGVLLDACQSAVNFSEFARQPIYRTPMQLDEFWKDLHLWVDQAESYAEDGYWPMNQRNCWACPFKKVCAHDPSSREEWMQKDFVRQERWDPLQSR